MHDFFENILNFSWLRVNHGFFLLKSKYAQDEHIVSCTCILSTPATVFHSSCVRSFAVFYGHHSLFAILFTFWIILINFFMTHININQSKDIVIFFIRRPHDNINRKKNLIIQIILASPKKNTNYIMFLCFWIFRRDFYLINFILFLSVCCWKRTLYFFEKRILNLLKVLLFIRIEYKQAYLMQAGTLLLNPYIIKSNKHFLIKDFLIPILKSLIIYYFNQTLIWEMFFAEN